MLKQQRNVFVAATAAILLAATVTEADTATINGITWTYTVSNGKASVGKDSSNGAISRSTVGAISIPSTLGGYPVTSIAGYAFISCSGLTSITIPSSVTSIGAAAFYDCTGLTSVTIPAGVTCIEENTFHSCSSLTSVTIPDTVTSIGNKAFEGCNRLSLLTIPTSVTSIGFDAFRACYALWANWYCALSDVAANGNGASNLRYALASSVSDRTIATVTVNGDSSIDSFVLTDGRVFDTVLRVINLSNAPSTLSMPSGYSYERLKGTAPLTIPALSTNLLTITRTADRVFFVAREELEPAQ